MVFKTVKEKKELEEFREMLKENNNRKVLSDTGDHWDLPEKYRATRQMRRQKAIKDAKEAMSGFLDDSKYEKNSTNENLELKKDEVFLYNLANNFDEDKLEVSYLTSLTRVEIIKYHLKYISYLKILITDNGVTGELLEEFYILHEFLNDLREDIQIKDNEAYNFAKMNIYLETKVIKNSIEDNDWGILYKSVNRLKKFFKDEGLI